MQAARILYTRVQFVHILHMCTLHVCCVERNICAAHILRLSIFVRVFLNYCAELGKELVHNTETSTKCQIKTSMLGHIGRNGFHST